MPERRYPDRQPKSQQVGEPPANLPVVDFDTTPVETVVTELSEVRRPETAQQFVDASLDVVDSLLRDDAVVRHEAVYAAAVRLAQRLEEYLVAPAEDGAEAGVATRVPSVFARALLGQNGNVENTGLYTDFVIEINQCVRAIARAVEERVDETASQRVHGVLSFDVVSQRLRVGNAEHLPEEMATAMQMPTETIFARFPELLQQDIAMQRTIPLQNPFAPQYAKYWEERRRATAIVQGIENAGEDKLPSLSELIAGRGEHAALLLTEEQESLEGDGHEDVHEAIAVLVDFLDQTSADIGSMKADDQAGLAKRLVNLNLLRERPENTIALLNACEVVKRHNPELFFRILGISTSLTNGNATESDLFGNPLMIALDQTNRDAAVRKVSPGFAVVKDRIDTLLSADARRSPLPYLNEQQLRDAEKALQQSLQGTDEAKGPNVIAMTMLLKYSPVLELGKLMREVGFERRGEYVDRIRNGMPREILADLMDMPEMLLEDPEVIAAWRERYDLDHPDPIHRYAMKAVFDLEMFRHQMFAGGAEFVDSLKSGGEYGVLGNPDISDDRIIVTLQQRKQYLEWAQAAIEDNTGIGKRVWRGTFGRQLSQEDRITQILKNSNPRQSFERIYETNMQFFAFGLWARTPKESYVEPGVMDQMIQDFVDADSAIPRQELSKDNAHNEIMSALQPLSHRGVLLSLFPQEDWMSADDWRDTYEQMFADKNQNLALDKPLILITAQYAKIIRSRKSVLTTIAYDPYIRPGRLFADLLGVNGATTRSMLEIVRLQPLPGKDSMYRHGFEESVRRSYSHIASDDVYLSRIAAGNFEFVEDPELLTPIERELHDLIEPLVMQKLGSEISTMLRTDIQALERAEAAGQGRPVVSSFDTLDALKSRMKKTSRESRVLFNKMIDRCLSLWSVEDAAYPLVNRMVYLLKNTKIDISELPTTKV